ncbi:MAG: carbamoyltransferase HypF [Candidatus Aminicenantes bacterium]|nr:MAG: carbamoyltransferase HypF [Candidatus Aminicenantes bacterium]
MNSKKAEETIKGSAIQIVVFGVVQGVGFRPFIYRLAKELSLKGWVKNIGFGVEIHLETEEKTDFKDFLKALQEDNPPLSQIENMTINPASFENLDDFKIKKSRKAESFVFISPDISICENCHTEMMSPSDRRFRYPFINCTDCGPRYTIVKSLPYDRPQTTMESFKMCEDCNREYTDPLDRRYHAQPVACPVCGPRVNLIESRKGKKIKGGIKKAASLIKAGKILAVKGLGGFHLVCDALNIKAVSQLRKIKERKTKPLALMASSLEIIEKYALLCPVGKEMLLSPRRPIVLLKKKKDIKRIAPHLDEMGFMLPYTPLHYLLLENLDLIVATSSNKKDAPIMKDEEEGIEELCDYILTHDRPIQIRADDSVMKIVDGKPLFLRRARGYVPYPQRVPDALASPSHILALGGELKDTISFYKNGYVITSQFLGDLDEYQNYKYFEETIRHLSNLFDIKPEAVVSDLHPDFHTTRFAQKIGLPLLQVQHHFAHVLAPLLEHRVPPGKKVLGVSFDGYGYGDDGKAWGGEFLLANYASYKRFAHFKYVPLPGGDLASKQPWRMAISYLMDTYGTDFPQIEILKKVSKNKIKGVVSMIEQEINSPLSSSCGRLFDAVSLLVGLSPLEVEFEAEAPMRLESQAAEGVEEGYGFTFGKKGIPFHISFAETIKSIINDLAKNTPPSVISAKFHNTLAQIITYVAEKVRKDHGIDTIVLIGGVFLNKRLLHTATQLLEGMDFKVLRPVNYSPNDESISVGQIAFALNKLKE